MNYRHTGTVLGIWNMEPKKWIFYPYCHGSSTPTTLVLRTQICTVFVSPTSRIIIKINGSTECLFLGQTHTLNISLRQFRVSLGKEGGNGRMDERRRSRVGTEEGPRYGRKDDSWARTTTSSERTLTEYQKKKSITGRDTIDLQTCFLKYYVLDTWS